MQSGCKSKEKQISPSVTMSYQNNIHSSIDVNLNIQRLFPCFLLTIVLAIAYVCVVTNGNINHIKKCEPRFRVQC